MEIWYAASLLGWSWSAWKFGKWHNFKMYHPTILLMIMCNFLYNFLAYNHMLWRYESPNLHLKHTVIELAISFIIFPSTVVLYLSYYPARFRTQLVYILCWVVLYAALEYAAVHAGLFSYHYGWNLAWSIVHNIVMFIVLRLHQSRLFVTYLICILTTLTFLLLFGFTMQDFH